MWKSRGCTLTPTVAARARRKQTRAIRHRQSKIPRARLQNLTRAHNHTPCVTSTHAHAPRARETTHRHAIARVGGTRTQILLFKLPSQVTLHKRRLPCFRGRKTRASRAHTSRQSLSRNRARIAPARAHRRAMQRRRSTACGVRVSRRPVAGIRASRARRIATYRYRRRRRG